MKTTIGLLAVTTALVAAGPRLLRAAQPGQMLWEFQTGGEVDSSPALGLHGEVYFGSADNKVYAVDGSTGAQVWVFATAGPVRSSPAVDFDGTVYVGSADGKVYALEGATGQQRWVVEIGHSVQASPAIGANGAVYMVSFESCFALDGRTGVRRWLFPHVYDYSGSPTVGIDGTVYVIGSRTKEVGYPMSRTWKEVALLALDGTTGEPKESSVQSGYVDEYGFQWVDLAIRIDGTLVGAANTSSIDYSPPFQIMVSGGIGLLYPNLTQGPWSRGWSTLIKLAPVIREDGAVFTGTAGLIQVLDGATGADLASYPVPGQIWGTPAFGSDGTLYVGATRSGQADVVHRLCALDGATGASRWEYPTGGEVHSSPAIGPTGVVYVGARDGKVYAVQGTGRLAGGGWPKFRGNAANRGSAEVVTGPPQIATQPQSCTVTLGSIARFTVVAFGTPPLAIQWSKEGSPLAEGGRVSGAGGSTLTISNAEETDAGTYTVAITNALGSATSSNALLTVTPPMHTATLDVTALIDGRDQLIIQGDHLQWHHFDNAAVGRHEGRNDPTTITTTLDGVTLMDHVDWIPEWPAPPPDDIRYEAFSSIYSPLSPAMPQSEMSVALDSLEARGAITLVQSPTAANGYTTVLEFNDDWWGSHATYRARLTYSVVPEPPRPPLITGQPARVVFREGVQGCITVRVGGFPTPEAQWFFAGAAVPGGTDATLTLPAVTRALEGIYWLVASNASGQATSAPILAVVSNVDPERFVAFQWAGRTEGGLTLESADRPRLARRSPVDSTGQPTAANHRTD